MAEPSVEIPQILLIHLRIAQFPILARRIRARMREELYQRGVITPERFEQEVREKALLSQRREGLTSPLVQEDASQWEQRLTQIRDYLTDFYFANNLPIDLFNQIVDEVLPRQSANRSQIALNFNPELAPLDLVLRQAEQFEALPEDKRAEVHHDLEELIVVLIKTMISDQLNFIRIAKNWFHASDFRFIQESRIGNGKIGGKAGGMLLAWKILQSANPEIAERVTLPRSYFVGADVVYDFMAFNGLEYFNQKYKTPEEIRQEYPQIRQECERGQFPEEIESGLRTVLKEIGKKPLIVRSSSLLEDNFGTSFAGKYASFFCPNQGSLEENLRDLTRAMGRVYASIFSPDALLYRRRMGLLDYDERMAILLQEVVGNPHRGYFFPDLAGVAFSRSPIVWSPRLRREEGFVRLVLGLGTRALERVGEDYPRLIALSHPNLKPEVMPKAIQYYSQRFIDLIDIERNAFTTLPVHEVLDIDYPALHWVASVRNEEMLSPVYAVGYQISPEKLVLTFDTLVQQNDFISIMKGILSTLEKHYQVPVDVEFAVNLSADFPQPRFAFYLLQCRPQSSMQGGRLRTVPAEVPKDDKILLATRMVPQGQVSGVEYIVYVDPMRYYRLSEPARRSEIARTVGRLNKLLEGSNFVLIGPGRWGSVNSQLGVPVTYADIYNARALVEIAMPNEGEAPEPSYGTHFFQDLVEAQIYPLAIYLDDSDDFLNRPFFDNAQNFLSQFLPDVSELSECLKLISVANEREGHHLEIVMDGEQGLGYLVRREQG